ncbi:NADH-quinone oxidoreductase subunit K [Plantibacter sp. VKM Ac-2885]|uniref:NADH-quinone oxidoreductase subunit K n=1 Tax=Plantibacter TaxID=190323 RepID=UPI0010C201C5|nr:MULTISPECIES: NADH-quinone oxidoreductase subunit K [Plantibacter]MBD8102507.1 NADH-quinone oxidoreductase subunit K [Plantibacter sp. CFBP 8775]MBD8515993.1 NADH-quinone oxidoreductase subunit K [Plantibacter sp. CFBP 8804]MBF4512591.1 NADH-quinone oxidoreductase subunit K [Plantibacter sp. VKM Ac-2885]MBF4565376.1 NADH-quinone oxidoreductase subunit K [Plantibacter sp. VKM Ac-2876]TKJ98549.1 Na(+)/H(+) antiporter subunit C [Plantibacter flavus]
MSASLTLVVLMAVMYGTGVYVMLERSLTRFLIGFVLVGNATNLLILIMSGPSGTAPLVTGTASDDRMVDPVPQVLMLTAIVINFGVTAFILALIYRTWWLAQLGDEGDTLSDEHADDTEAATEAVFNQVDLDDEAIQRVLDESNEHGDDRKTTRKGAGE